MQGEFLYQAEDLARILSKTKSAYIGYDMGGGKTVSAFVFNAIRNVKRVLVVCQSSLIENWINEAEKFGFKAQRLTTHDSITLLQRAIDSKTESPGTTFYITSYEFLSLDTGRVYDPWTCIKYDKDGNEKHHIEGNTSRTCQGCSTEYSFIQRQCPKCKAKEEWTGENCLRCGYSAYTYSSKSIKQYPAYKRIKKLFRSVIIDESQQAKSKTSFRGQAVRAIHAKSRLELTGTLMKGYITDTFFNLGYITRHNNPLFPYRFDRRGSKLFAEEFSTFEFKDIQFEDTLHKGRKKELPEVSNLNRFWKILGTCTIRRLKDEMVELPPKTRRVMALTLDPAHASEYGIIVEEAKKKIDREMRKPEEEINMGVISKALWSMRFGATIPRISPDHNVKIQKAIEITEHAREQGEKVLVYSALREMQATLHQEFVKHGINHIFVPSTMQTKDRFKNIKRFQEDPGITAIVAGLNVLNRGFTITAANHVIFTDVEYSPESTDQAEDRAHRTGQGKGVICWYLLIDWPDPKTNIDMKMYNLISQKKKAISNAIDGKVRFGKTARVLRAGGDYMALAKAINGEIEEPLDFEYEREGRKEVLAEIRVAEEVLTHHDNGKWESLWQEVQDKKNGNGRDEKGVRVIHEKVNNQLTLFSI
jgi:SNF2 family DNA or RNA helicase